MHAQLSACLIIIAALYAVDAIDVEPLDLDITLSFDPLDPNYHQSRIHIWSPQKEQVSDYRIPKPPTPDHLFPTQSPTEQPFESCMKPAKRCKKTKQKAANQNDDEAFLEEAITQRKQSYKGSIKIYLCVPALITTYFEKQLIIEHPNDYAIVSWVPLNNTNAQIREYCGPVQAVLDQTKILIIIFCTEWLPNLARSRLYRFANSMRKWLSDSISVHKETSDLRFYFSTALSQALNQSVTTANQLQIYECLYDTYTYEQNHAITTECAPNFLFGDPNVLDFIKLFALKTWSLAWDALYVSITHILRESEYASTGLIPNVTLLIEKTTMLHVKYKPTIELIMDRIDFRASSFSLFDLKNKSAVDSLTLHSNYMEELENECLNLLDPLRIAHVIYNLKSALDFEQYRDISVVVQTTRILEGLLYYLVAMLDKGKEIQLQYFIVSPQYVNQVKNLKGTMKPIKFHVKKMKFDRVGYKNRNDTIATKCPAKKTKACAKAKKRKKMI